jgi:protocatechuate 3,4-dioxygenase beta subunit
MVGQGKSSSKSVRGKNDAVWIENLETRQLLSVAVASVDSSPLIHSAISATTSATAVATGSVSGAVTDSGGHPVASAAIFLAPAAGGADLATGTNASGQYSFASGVPVGSYVIHVVHSGYFSSASGTFTVTSGKNTAVPVIKLVTVVYGSVSGTVTDSGGKPISGAQVSATSSTPNNPGINSVLTNSVGAYTFPNVPIGMWEIRALPTGYVPATTPSITVTQGANTVAPTLKLALAASMTGSVTDSNSAALANATVNLFAADNSIGYSAITTSTGAYSFTGLTPGNYTLHVFDTGYSSFVSSTLTLSVGANPQATIKLTKIVYGSVTGKITDTGGNPIASAAVYLDTAAGLVVNGVPGVHTDSGGNYSFPSVPVGSYEIVANTTGYFQNATAVFAVVSGANTAPTLKLTQGASVTGSVTDTSNAPVGGTEVALSPAPGSTSTNFYAALTNSSGVYTFGVVIPASYVIRVYDASYLTSTTATITIKLGANSLSTIRLTKALFGSVSGKVTDASGKPISGATVGVTSSNTANPTVSPATTDANGNYSFPSVPIGATEVIVRANGYVAESSSSFTVSQGTNSVVPTLKLPQAAVVIGTITNASNAPVAGASVSIISNSAGGTSYGTVTNSSGQYTFSNVPAGNYEIEVYVAGYYIYNSASFTVVAGADAAPKVVLTAAPTIIVTGPGTTASPGSVLNTLTPTITWDAATGVTGYEIFLFDVTAQKTYVFNAGASATSYKLAAGILTSGHVIPTTSAPLITATPVRSASTTISRCELDRLTRCQEQVANS